LLSVRELHEESAVGERAPAPVITNNEQSGKQTTRATLHKTFGGAEWEWRGTERKPVAKREQLSLSFLVAASWGGENGDQRIRAAEQRLFLRPGATRGCRDALVLSVLQCDTIFEGGSKIKGSIATKMAQKPINTLTLMKLINV